MSPTTPGKGGKREREKGNTPAKQAGTRTGALDIANRREMQGPHQGPSSYVECKPQAEKVCIGACTALLQAQAPPAVTSPAQQQLPGYHHG